jgi:prepilin-type N-terminal cleavage/methylation domain-containing protein
VYRHNSRHAFSLIELIVVIAVIAVLAGVISWRIFGVNEASKYATYKQNIQLWNSAYCNVVAAQPSFATTYTTWSDASSQLATGVEITFGGSTMIIRAESPNFFDTTIRDRFVAGKGITTAP